MPQWVFVLNTVVYDQEILGHWRSHRKSNKKNQLSEFWEFALQLLKTTPVLVKHTTTYEL